MRPDPVRRPLQTVRQLATTDATLRDVDGWEILAFYLEGRLTAEQAAQANSMRVRLLRGERKRAA